MLQKWQIEVLKKNNTGLKSIEEKQLISRHEVKCTLEDIIEKSSKLLKSLGEFYMVHRAERLVDIMCLLRKYKLTKVCLVCSSEISSSGVYSSISTVSFSG